MGVLGSLIANCTVLSLSLAIPIWAAPASGPLLPTSAGPLLPTSSRLFCPPLFTSFRLSAFYVRFVSLAKKILALTRRVMLGWGCLLVQNGFLTA